MKCSIQVSPVRKWGAAEKVKVPLCSALILIALLFLGTLQVSGSEVLPLSVTETVRQAEAIVSGTITGANARWGNANKSFMYTDYTVKLDEVLHGEVGAPQGGEITITYWGGTLDGKTLQVSDVRLPKIGEKLILMLRPRWKSEPGFAPVVGLNHGLLALTTEADGQEIVRDARGTPLALAGKEAPARRGSAPALRNAPTVKKGAFNTWIKANLRSIKASPSEVPAQPDKNDKRLLKPIRLQPGKASDSLPTHPPATRSLRSSKAVAATPAEVAKAQRPALNAVGEEVIRPRIAKYRYDGRANLPIVVNNLPDSFTPWSPEDEYQMSNWNYYAGEIFRVFTTPKGTYSGGDGVFDLCGFPTSADLASQYGSGWDANTIGVCFVYTNSSNTIVEADIALNPAFGFTLDDEWIYSGSTAQGFRQVMTHELGHMHGLDHEFDYLSVMNYLPGPYRAFGLPYADDAEGARANYTRKAVTDLGVYMYRSTGYQGAGEATYPTSVNAGGTISFNNYHVENVGTTVIATPKIEWYLTGNRNFSGTYYYLGEATYNSINPFSFFTPSTVGQTFTVPADVPSGSYYLAAYIRDDAGASQPTFPFSNNRAFTRSRIVVNGATLYDIAVSASPAAGGTVAGGGTFAANTSRTVTAQAASGYTFVNWTENGVQQSSSSSYTFTVTRSRNLVANFTPSTYTVAVSASPSAGGTVSGGGTFTGNTSRTVTATPNGGYTFVNWTENGVQQSTSASYTFTLTGSRTLVANFSQVQYTVAVSASSTAGGTVSGGGTFAANSSRTVTATANSGYVFVNWTENGVQQSTSASYTFTLTGSRTLVANFGVVQYTVAVNASPAAGGTVSGGGTFGANSSRTVTATANSGYAFVNWTENGVQQSTSASYAFTLTGNRSLVANFSLVQYTVAVSASPGAGGTASGGGTFAANSSRTVTAAPNSGYAFVNWTENGVQQSTSASYTFTLTGNRTLVANFNQLQYTVGVSAIPSAAGTVSGGGTFSANSSRTVTATANSGYTFVNWTENGVQQSTSPSYTFTLTASRTLVANFNGSGPQVTLSASPASGGTVTGGGNFPLNTSVVVTAAPNAGFVFVNWTENGVEQSTAKSYTFSFTGARSLVANFIPAHPADHALTGASSTDMQVTINEVTAYGAAWKQGSVWPIGPTPIDLNYLTRAGFLWKSGEAYRYDTAIAAPLCWLPRTAALRAERLRGGRSGTAVRSITAAPEDRSKYRVAISVQPGAGVSAYAVEESLPGGESLVELSDGAMFNPLTGTIKWGPFLDDAPRTLSYSISVGGERLPNGEMRGRISCDGVASAISGVVSLLDVAAGAYTGSYHALFGGQPLSYENAGYLRVDVTGSGKFTAHMTRGGRRSTARGTVLPDGTLRQKRAQNGAAMVPGLRLTTAGEDGVTIQCDTGFVTAYRAPFSEDLQTALAGQYHVGFSSGGSGSAAGVEGGAGTVIVRENGTVRAVLRSANGLRFSQSSALSGEGSWAMYLSSNRRRSSVIGSIQMPEAGSATAESAITCFVNPASQKSHNFTTLPGTLWIKPQSRVAALLQAPANVAERELQR